MSDTKTLPVIHVQGLHKSKFRLQEENEVLKLLSTLPRWVDVVCQKVFANLLSVESKLMHVTA